MLFGPGLGRNFSVLNHIYSVFLDLQAKERDDMIKQVMCSLQNIARDVKNNIKKIERCVDISFTFYMHGRTGRYIGGSILQMLFFTPVLFLER